MLKLTPERRVLFVRSLWLTLLVLFGVFSLTLTLNRKPQTAYADSASTINFQARLQTAAGAIVPDGDYNVEFKLYNDATLSGAHLLWTETRTGGNTVAVKNGYLSVNLGSVTAFGSIDWSQKLWLTMNIGGTGTPSWDGEMDPRLPLTAIPYAFQSARASQADQLSTIANGNTSTLSIQGSASGHGSQTFVVQDQGAAGTYNLLTQNQANASYVQLQGASPTTQTGNIAVSGTVAADTFQGNYVYTDNLKSNGGTITVNGGVGATPLGVAAFSVIGGIDISGVGNAGNDATFTTPGGATRYSAISIEPFSVAYTGAAISIGVVDGDSNAAGYGIIAFDQRSGVHNPTIAIASPDENQNFGLSFDGSNEHAYLKTTANSITLQANGTNMLKADANSGSVIVNGSLQATGLDTSDSGNLTIAGNNASTINIAANDLAHTINIGTGNYDQFITIGGAQGNSATVINSSGGGTFLNSTTNITAHADEYFKVQNASGVDLLSVNGGTNEVITTNASTFIVGGSAQFNNGLTSLGGLNFTSTASTVYISPLGAGIGTVINVPNRTLGAHQQILAVGVKGDSDETARGITVLDARTGSHQPTIAVLSPNESNIMGLSWDGSDTIARLKTNTSTVALQAGDIDILKADNVSGSSVVTIGNPTSSAGQLRLANAASSSLVTIQAGTTSGDYTIQLPTTTGTSGQCLALSSVSDSTQTLGYSNCELSNGTDFIQNQNGTTQTANFKISGTGVAGALQAPSVDTASAGTFTIGGTNATGVSIMQNTTVTGNLTITGSVAYQHGSNYSATGTQNDVNFGSGVLFRLTGASPQTITGIAGGVDGRRITLVNAAGQAATLSNNSGSSSPGNQIITGTGSDFTLAAGASAELVYDSVSAVWRIVGAVAGGVGGGSYVTLQGGSPVADTGNFMVSGTGSAATLQASTFDTASAVTLNIGTTNATSISLNKATTISATSTTAFKIQNASNVVLLTADTSTGTITLGTGSNTVVFTASGGLVASGTAQHAKTILLTPEYAGAVLDALSDASCTSANNGTLTAGYDSTNRMNYYNWTSAQATAQCYDVVVQVPIPSDFSSWSGAPDIEMKKDSTGTGAYAIQIVPSSSTDANYGSYVSPGTLSTSWGNMATSSLSGTYTAGNYLTIKVRVTSTNNANVQLGNIKLTYNSKF